MKHKLQTLVIKIGVSDLKLLSELCLGVKKLKICVVDWS